MTLTASSSLISTALHLAASMDPSDAAAMALNEALKSAQIHLSYPVAYQLLKELGTTHPDRPQLQVAASSAVTAEEFHTVMLNALTAIACSSSQRLAA